MRKRAQAAHTLHAVGLRAAVRLVVVRAMEEVAVLLGLDDALTECGGAAGPGYDGAPAHVVGGRGGQTGHGDALT